MRPCAEAAHGPHAAHSLHNNSACMSTVLTASSCKSGGYPNRFRILLTNTLILALALSLRVQSMDTLCLG